MVELAFGNGSLIILLTGILETRDSTVVWTNLRWLPSWGTDRPWLPDFAPTFRSVQDPATLMCVGRGLQGGHHATVSRPNRRLRL